MKRLGRVVHVPLLLALSAAAACGSTSAPDGDDGADGADGSDGDGTPTPDAGIVVPTLVSSVPADGEAGVRDDATIVLTFSVAMDPDTVEIGYFAPALGDVEKTWNNEHTELTIKPVAPLAYAEGQGNDPAEVPAKSYQVIIGSAAASAAGVPLAENISVTFTTLKRMDTTAGLSLPLSRSVHANGLVLAEGADLRVGDTVLNDSTRALLTFDLAKLPASTVGVESAILATRQLAVFGVPYTIDTTVNAYHLSYADPAAGHAAFPLSMAGAFSVAGQVVVEIDVTEKVKDDVANRAGRLDRSQYRLQFEKDHNNNSKLDYTQFALANFELQITYLVP